MAGAPRPPLLLSGAGAVLVLVDPAEPVGGLVGLGLILAGALLVWSQGATAERPGAMDGGWRRLLLAGAAAAAVGVPLALVVETVGGLIAAAGSAAVVAAVALGFPERPAA